MRQPHFNSFLSASCSNTQDIATANSVPRTESNFATITFTESITEQIFTLKSNQQICCIEVVSGHYPSNHHSIPTKNNHLNRRTLVERIKQITLSTQTKDELNQTGTFSGLLIGNDSFGHSLRFAISSVKCLRKLKSPRSSGLSHRWYPSLTIMWETRIQVHQIDSTRRPHHHPDIAEQKGGCGAAMRTDIGRFQVSGIAI